MPCRHVSVANRRRSASLSRHKVLELGEEEGNGLLVNEVQDYAGDAIAKFWQPVFFVQCGIP